MQFVAYMHETAFLLHALRKQPDDRFVCPRRLRLAGAGRSPASRQLCPSPWKPAGFAPEVRQAAEGVATWGMEPRLSGMGPDSRRSWLLGSSGPVGARRALYRFLAPSLALLAVVLVYRLACTVYPSSLGSRQPTCQRGGSGGTGEAEWCCSGCRKRPTSASRRPDRPFRPPGRAQPAPSRDRSDRGRLTGERTSTCCRRAGPVSIRVFMTCVSSRVGWGARTRPATRRGG
jgi:hypothetical protein